MSVRRLPKVTLEQVLKVCQHYEQKCSGKYSSKTLAARYVFALSREVSKLVSTLRDVRSLETSRLAYLEELMREWEEVFGQPSRHILMGAAGDGLVQVTPRSVHAALRRAEERCVTVEGALDALRSQHQAHIDRFEAVIDEHHAASRKQYHSEMTRQKRRFHAESEQVRSLAGRRGCTRSGRKSAGKGDGMAERAFESETDRHRSRERERERERAEESMDMS